MRGRGRGGHGNNTRGSSNDLTKAASVLGGDVQQVQVFSNSTDPFNPSNTLSGGTAKQGFTFCSVNRR
jgi:hypothetical protein